MKFADLLLALMPPFDHVDEKMRNWQITVAFVIYALIFFAGWSFGVLPAAFGGGYALADEVNKNQGEQERKLISLTGDIVNIRKDLLSAKLHDKEIERCRILSARSNDISDELRNLSIETLDGFLRDKSDEYFKISKNAYVFQDCRVLLVSAGGR